MAFHPMVISTDDLPARDRDAAIRDYYGKIAMRFELESVGDDPLAIHGRTLFLPDMRITKGRVSAMAANRSSRMRGDGSSGILLSVCKQGYVYRERGRGEVRTRASEALLSSLDRPMVITVSAPANEVLTLQMARKTLATLAPTLDDRISMSPIVATTGLSLLRRYAAGLFDESALAPAMPALAARHLFELAALVIGAETDRWEAMALGGLRAARLAAAKSTILAMLDRPDLSAVLVAAKLNVSSRYLHMLFEEDGRTYGAFVKEQRLARAFQALVDPRQRGRRIIDIALETGFGDVGAFNRAFRRRFGQTPSDARAAARERG